MAQPRCYNCGNPIECDTPGKFCGIPCRDDARRELERAEFEQRTRESVGLGPRPPAPVTLSVEQGFQVSADLAGQYDAYEHRMRLRRDLTSPREKRGF